MIRGTAYCLPPTAYLCQVVVLIVFCLALYLPGLQTIPPLDRDEARFAQATRQMVQTGDFIHPHFQAESRLRKPIGIYWLQCLSVVFAGGASAAIWAYRVPSVIGAVLAVLLTLAVGRVLFAPPVAFLGALLLATAVLVVVEAHMATADAALLATIVAAQSCLAVLYRSARAGRVGPARYAIGFWIAQGLGILLKGPVAPLVSGLTIATLAIADRKCGFGRTPQTDGRKGRIPDTRHPTPDTLPQSGWRNQLRPGWGLLVTAAIVLPWTIAVASTAGSFWREWLNDVLPKLMRGQESHGAPPGAYLLMLPITFWPGSLVAGLGILSAVRRRANAGERFCLAWLVPAWLFFELVPTKLPHYVLPLYPALALLTASVAVNAVELRPVARVVAALGVLVWSLVGIAIAVGALAAPMWLGAGFDLGGMMAAVMAVILVLTVVRLYRRGKLPTAVRMAPVGATLVMFLVFASVMPGLDRLWLSRSAARAIADCCEHRSRPRRLAAAGYQEPSLVFLLEEPVQMVGAEDGAAFLDVPDDAVLLLAGHTRGAFERAANARGLQVRELWSVSGFNYSKGEPVSLHLLERARPATLAVDPRP